MMIGSALACLALLPLAVAILIRCARTNKPKTKEAKTQKEFTSHHPDGKQHRAGFDPLKETIEEPLLTLFPALSPQVS
jgi:hypothetical protein